MSRKLKLSLSNLLKNKKFPNGSDVKSNDSLHDLQLKMLRVQQGIWHSKQRAIIVFEGFDAAGKGGAIRRITEGLDPRSIKVYSIGPPDKIEQEKHYLYRFWQKLPEKGVIAVFDRSWYGRVLVERVEGLTKKERWEKAYEEINEFEKMLIDDGVDLVKIFLAIHPAEQLKRFEDRLNDPYKQWKMTFDDLKARKKWAQYVKASDDMFAKTHTSHAPWHLIPADSKNYTRSIVLEIVTQKLGHHCNWIESTARKAKYKKLKEAIDDLETEVKKN